MKVRFKVYKKVAKEIFPNALIIPDKSHLVAEVNSALDKVQKRLRRREKRELVETVDEEKRIWFLLMKSEENLRRRERLWQVLKFEPILRRAYGFRNEERKD